MATHSRIGITLLASLFMALPVSADTLRATIVTDIVEKDKKPSDKTPYLLTIDGGNTWVIANKAEAFCAQMDTAEFFRYLGSLAIKFESIVNLDITEPQVKKVHEKRARKSWTTQPPMCNLFPLRSAKLL